MSSFTGTSAANHIVGTASADTIHGYGGNDILEGLGGNDKIYGGGGNDTITGGTGNDTLSGGAGSDVFVFAAGDGQDIVSDLGFGDVIRISGYTAAQSVTQVGTDVVVTLSSSDKVTFSNETVTSVQAALHFGSGPTGGSGGGTGTTINGTAGNDTLSGTSGNDTIKGLGGNDTIRGGAGDDHIYGGLGADTLDGGAGRDTFIYISTSESHGWSVDVASDTIMNWNPEDKIDLSGIDANTLAAGNQAFTFAGYATPWDFFWHGAGNLYIVNDGTNITIVGYTDSDSTPDLIINIDAPLGEGSVTLGDLIL